MIHKKQTEYLACWLSDSTVRGCFNETLSNKCLLLSFVFLSLTWVNKGVSEQDSDLVVVGTQELCNYSFMLGKQILQQSYQKRPSILILRPSIGVQITQNKISTYGITLKVFRASEAISKFGSSTYSKNSSKLPDSNIYLKEHFKIKCIQFNV